MPPIDAREPDDHAPPPSDGPPIIESTGTIEGFFDLSRDVPSDVRDFTVSVDFSDFVAQLKDHGLIDPWTPRDTRLMPPDPITPAEAAEEMDDAEAAEVAAHDAAETRADAEPGGKPSWGELFTSDEADRRFDLDFLDLVSSITANFARPVEGPEGETAWKLVNAPDGVEGDIVRFLRALLKTGATIARRYGENG